MDLQERTSLIYRIIKGKQILNILGHNYIIYTPNINILSNAQHFYNKIINEYKFYPWLREDECERILIYNGLWTPDTHLKIDDYNTKLDNLKLELYKGFFDFRKRKHYKNEIEKIKNELIRLNDIRTSLDYLTATGFAIILQSQYILSKTVYYKKRLVFPHFNLANYSLINLMQLKINESILLPDTLKEIARSEPWSSIWKAGKPNVFCKKGVQLTVEQRNLILFSQMYDSIDKHPERPHEDIINDNDALEGWMIAQRKENESKKDDKASKSFNVQDNAQEIFIPVSSKQELMEVEKLNTPESKFIKQQRKIAIDNAGIIDDVKLPDKQMELRKLLIEKAKAGIR
jgi:hypothetical protein